MYPCATSLSLFLMTVPCSLDLFLKIHLMPITLTPRVLELVPTHQFKQIFEDKIFTPHGFILLATRITSTLSWILRKSLLKPKRAHIHRKTPKPMVQNSWRYNLIKAHSLSSCNNISFSAHDPSS